MRKGHQAYVGGYELTVDEYDGYHVWCRLHGRELPAVPLTAFRQAEAYVRGLPVTCQVSEEQHVEPVSVTEEPRRTARSRTIREIFEESRKEVV
jgi:hypothetical protein